MQKVKGVKVTRKVKIVERKFCIKKTHTFTIIAMNYVQEQLKTIFFFRKLEWRVAVILNKINPYVARNLYENDASHLLAV